MPVVKTVADWMTERGIDLLQLTVSARLDDRIAKAIVAGRYTPSPEQRQRVAALLGVAVEQIAWNHANLISHVQGHGPQFGRSP